MFLDSTNVSDCKESWFRYVIYMLCPRKCLSMVTPRLHTAGLGRMVDSMMLTSGILWWMENREVKWAISVLSGLHARPLEVHQMRMSVTHSSSVDKAAERSFNELIDTYNYIKPRLHPPKARRTARIEEDLVLSLEKYHMAVTYQVTQHLWF